MKRFKDILFVVEPGDACKPALERAIALAQSNQASLSVVAVVERVVAGIGMPGGGPISADLQAAIVGAHAKELEALLAPHRQKLEIKSQVLVGVQFLEVIREVLRGGHDLVIKPPETGDWLQRLFGSDDMHLLRKCPCPVWLVRAQPPRAFRHVLATVDVADSYPQAELSARHALNLQVLELAGAVALADFSELHVVHAWDAIGESTMRGAFARLPEEQVADYVLQVRRHHEVNLEALMRELAGRLGKEAMDYLKPRIHLVKGWARKEIPALARHIGVDLVVMGTVGRTGIPGFIMGNTAESILNQIDASVLAVKPPGFETPVRLGD